jgi:hypothetical protein
VKAKDDGANVKEKEGEKEEEDDEINFATCYSM